MNKRISMLRRSVHSTVFAAGLTFMLLLGGCEEGGSSQPGDPGVVVINGPDAEEVEPDIAETIGSRILIVWAEEGPEEAIQRWRRVADAAPDGELRIADLSETHFRMQFGQQREANQRELVTRVERFREMTSHLRNHAFELGQRGEMDEARAILSDLERWGRINAARDLVALVRLTGEALEANAAHELKLLEEHFENDGDEQE